MIISIHTVFTTFLQFNIVKVVVDKEELQYLLVILRVQNIKEIFEIFSNISLFFAVLVKAMLADKCLIAIHNKTLLYYQMELELSIE